MPYESSKQWIEEKLAGKGKVMTLEEQCQNTDLF